MSPEVRADADRRLAKIEGQVRGVRKMVGDDRYCVDVLTQLAALRGGIDRLSAKVLADHVAHCALHGAHAHPDRPCDSAELVAELDQVLGKLLR